MTRNTPDIIEVTSERFEEVLNRADSNTLRDEDMELMRQVFASYAGFFQMVGDKKTTIARLRKMMFGATSEKSQNVLGAAEDVPKQPPGDASEDASTDSQGNTRARNHQSLGPVMAGMLPTIIRVPTRST